MRGELDSCPVWDKKEFHFIGSDEFVRVALVTLTHSLRERRKLKFYGWNAIGSLFFAKWLLILWYYSFSSIIDTIACCLSKSDLGSRKWRK